MRHWFQGTLTEAVLKQMSLCVPRWMEFSNPCLILPSALLPSMLCLGLLFGTKGQVFLVECVFSTFMMCVCISQLFDAVLKNNSVDMEKEFSII